MIINTDTKVIGRFHTQKSGRGLNIYNPFFEEAGINAAYFLFYAPTPKPLVEGLRNLNLAGAVTVGFELDPEFPKLLDRLDPVSLYVKRVGFIKNQNGKVTGFYQGGKGILRAIQKATEVTDKNIVIVGSGNVTKGLLLALNDLPNKPKSIQVFNRTLENIERLKTDFSFISGIETLDKLPTATGDILVNATDIGGKVEDSFYTESIIKNFETVVDVTFEKEDTNLINLGKKLGKKYSTGWDMFTGQGQVVLETILEQEIPWDILRKHVVSGLSQVVT